MARRPLAFELEYPWEAARGSALERTLGVHAEAQRVYAQQKALLPTLQLERAPNPEAAARVRDVGRRTHVLREHEALGRHRWRAGDSPQKRSGGSLAKRVVPSRFPEEADVGDAEEGGEASPDHLNGRIETMLMDQEWDTRGWTRAKVHAAVDALYSKVEGSSDPSRRDLATTMLVRLLEIHEDAVGFVETTIPTLSNKAFRTLAKTNDSQRTFRVATLLGVLSQWFPRVLSAENAIGKSVGFLLRETELCARIVQHHWRGVYFERSLHKREYDASVRARIRSMHLIKFVELRHQFKVFREVLGGGGLPIDAVQAYVSIVYRLVKNQPDDVDMPRSTPASSPTTSPNYVLANQRKLISSGALAYLSSLVTASQRPAITEMIISIVTETAVGQGPDKVIDVLQSNIVERVQAEMQRLLLRIGHSSSNSGDEAMMDAALDLIRVLSEHVLAGLQRFGCFSSTSAPRPTSAEDAYLLGKLTRLAIKFLTTSSTIEGLFQVLHASCSPQRQRESRCTKVLATLRLMACCSFGFPQVLELLTRNGGRYMELTLQCLLDPRRSVSSEALALFCEITDHPHGRQGLTTAGAVRTFIRWCQAGGEDADERDHQVLGLIGCALIARQTAQHDKVSQSWLLPAAQTARGRLDALYKLLLALVAKEDQGGNRSSADAEQSAVYFLRNNALSALVTLLTPVTPTCMEPPSQSPHHRSISCIVLSRFFRVPQVARACFSEDVVNHLALSLQCNRLDEIEKAVARYSPDMRLVHRLGSKEACKALTRLARCSSGSSDTSGIGDGAVVARLRPSIASHQVPELPQAMVCDVLFRLHVVEDLVAYIKPVDFSADSPEVETALTAAAVELAGHLRPLPFGEAARVKFFKIFGAHDHGRYANDKLMLLVEVVAPSILRVLREPSLHADLVDACCVALSRLACTNAACSALMTQGCLQTALMHLPEFLFDPKRDKAGDRSKTTTSEWVVDSDADQHGLLKVPASLYTLLGKLCAVAEGRAAIMRAQVLPRILKRLQLTDPSSQSIDVDCKSEIAAVITRLAMVHTLEGNTSELFIHFGVLDLLMQLLKAHHTSKRQGGATTVNNANSSHPPSKAEATRLRVVSHVLGAIAALSQDLLVCVPRLVNLGVLPLLPSFLGVDRSGDSTQPTSVRADSMKLHAMQIVHSIAAYPFGEYHVHLASTSVSESTRSSSSTTAKRREATPAASSLMEQVRRIGYDFAAELRGREAAVTVGSKTVGDLARETLAVMNEKKPSNQQPAFATAVSPTRSVGAHRSVPHEQAAVVLSSSPSPTPASAYASAAFPALSSSASRVTPSRRRPSSEPSASSLPCASSCVALSPSQSTASPTPIVNIHPASLTKLNGIDLATTRPPGKSGSQSQQQTLVVGSVASSSSAPPSSPRYIFATPKPRKRSSARDAAISSLMLDPLFDSAPSATHNQRHERRHRHQREDQRHYQRGDTTDNDEDGYAFVQETDRFGHLVQVKGRRARRGDQYVPSLGLITSDSAPAIAFHS